MLEIKPIGLEASGGSTPLRLRIAGEPDSYVFAKLYAKSHVRADRWYKLGRMILYGSLEDETSFQTVRRFVQYEDYTLRLMQDVKLPVPAPYGIVEITPEREYLIVMEFFDGAVEINEAEVDDEIIDEGLLLIRKMWDAGLAHRDIKPGNLMVRDGRVLLVDAFFVQVRPSPWRQAVDLGNMMLVLAVGSDPGAGLPAGPAVLHPGGDRRGVRRHPRGRQPQPAAADDQAGPAGTCWPSSGGSRRSAARSRSSAGAYGGSPWPPDSSCPSSLPSAARSTC